MKIRNKPVIRDGIIWTGRNIIEVREFFGGHEGMGKWSYAEHGLLDIYTLEGDHTAQPGDWIIKGVKGEFYPCKPDIFELTYEKLES